MKHKIQEIFDQCGTYIAPNNKDVTLKEIEFLCEMLILRCADICDHHAKLQGEELSKVILDHFDLKYVKSYLPDDRELNDCDVFQIRKMSSATNIPEENFIHKLFD